MSGGNVKSSTWTSLSTVRYLPKRDESVSSCKALSRVIACPSCWMLKDWMWPTEKEHGPEVIFIGSYPRGHLSQGEGTGRVQVRWSVAWGALPCQGRSQKVQQGTLWRSQEVLLEKILSFQQQPGPKCTTGRSHPHFPHWSFLPAIG